MKAQYDFAHTREARVHGSARVPFGLYENRMPEMYGNVPAHWHEEFELNAVRAGKGILFLDGERYAVSAGDILIIPPNVLHAAYPEKGAVLHYDALVFHPSMLGGGVDRSVTDCVNPLIRGQMTAGPLVAAGSSGYPAVADAVRQIFAAARKNTARDDLLLKSGLLQLVYLLEEGGPPRQPEERPDHRLIRPALSYLAEHYAEPVTIGQLAGYCNLSKSYFMGCFKRATGMSAMEHLCQLRIRAACEALGKTGRSVSEIAADCGFQNLSGFNRQFKKRVGCSPAQYRKSAGHPPEEGSAMPIYAHLPK